MQGQITFVRRSESLSFGIKYIWSHFLVFNKNHYSHFDGKDFGAECVFLYLDFCIYLIFNYKWNNVVKKCTYRSKYVFTSTILSYITVLYKIDQMFLVPVCYRFFFGFLFFFAFFWFLWIKKTESSETAAETLRSFCSNEFYEVRTEPWIDFCVFWRQMPESDRSGEKLSFTKQQICCSMWKPNPKAEVTPSHMYN